MKQQLNEVKKLQKLAGILKENFNFEEDSNSKQALEENNTDELFAIANKEGSSVKAIVSPDKRFAWVLHPRATTGDIHNAIVNNEEFFKKHYDKGNGINIEKIQNSLASNEKNRQKIDNKEKMNDFLNQYEEVFLIKKTSPNGEEFIKLK